MAAIPLPLVKDLLGPYLVFLSSTINGYEGTGRYHCLSNYSNSSTYRIQLCIPCIFIPMTTLFLLGTWAFHCMLWFALHALSCSSSTKTSNVALKNFLSPFCYVSTDEALLKLYGLLVCICISTKGASIPSSS